MTAPKWKIGDRVLLLDKRIKPHSDQVITHRPYNLGPLYVVDIVKGHEGIGQAYRLVDCSTGKPYRRLVSADRLKITQRIELISPHASHDWS